MCGHPVHGILGYGTHLKAYVILDFNVDFFSAWEKDELRDELRYQKCRKDWGAFTQKQLIDLYTTHELRHETSTAASAESTPDIQMYYMYYQFTKELQKSLDIPYFKLFRYIHSEYLTQRQKDFLNQTHDKHDQDDLEDITKLIEDLGKDYFSDLVQPKIHGDFRQDSFLIPLCSFNEGELKSCDSFKKSEGFYQDDNICHTFNFDGTKFGKGLKPKFGLNFVLNYRLARMKESDAEKYATVIIHPPGTLPNFDQFIANSYKITPKSDIFIGVKASLTEITETFATLKEDQRHCKLNIGKDKAYNHINCQMANSLQKALKTCQCNPWFYPSNHSICFGSNLKCFNDIMKNESEYLWNPVCPQACSFSKYEINVKENEFEENSGLKGEAIKTYFSEENLPLFLDFDTIYSGTGVNDERYYGRTSVVHVNFDHPQATVTTKSAKMNLYDQVGSIGGTFGIFLGLSMVGILDFLIWICECFKLPSKVKKIFS